MPTKETTDELFEKVSAALTKYPHWICLWIKKQNFETIRELQRQASWDGIDLRVGLLPPKNEK